MTRRRARTKKKDSPPTYDVDPTGVFTQRFGTDEVRTIVGPVAARYSNWETINSDLRIASESLKEFFEVRANYLAVEPNRIWRSEQDLFRRLTQLWTTAVTFFYRCYKANGKRRNYLVNQDFPQFGQHNVIDAVKHHRDKAIHHSVSAADAATVGMSFREGEFVGVVSASNRRFFPDPRWPHAERFRDVVEHALLVAQARFYWAQLDLHEYGTSLTREERAELPEGLTLPDPSFGLGELPRPDDGGSPAEATQPKPGYLNPIRVFSMPGVRLSIPSEGVAVRAEEATETVGVRGPDGVEAELTCKVGVFAELLSALERRDEVPVECETEKSPGGLENRTRVIRVVEVK